MNKYVKALMEREKNNQSVQKNIVDHIKASIKDGVHDEYNFLQDNNNAKLKFFKTQRLAVLSRHVADIMMSHYQDKEVTAGVNEFFSKFKQLGVDQDKEKAVLAYNFFFSKPDHVDYPFQCSITKQKNGKTVKHPCGRDFMHLQGSELNPLTEKEVDDESFKLDFIGYDFVHIFPFGCPEDEITKRIYINTTSENAYNITLELLRKCAEHPDDKNYQAYVKFDTTNVRNDTMLAYCTEKNFDIMFDLVHEIYEEHKEWFNGTGKLPLMTNICDEKNNHLILGIADEPTVARTSFNQLFCEEIIEPFIKDLAQKNGVKRDDLNKLPAEVIDKCVTYDALKPYIEKTCYSADYPFLTKDTVKKMQMQKTVANTQQATVQATQTEQVVESTQNHFQPLHDDKLAKDLTELGLV